MPKIVDSLKKNERYLIFDESGNLGSSGRYFIIACIDTNNYKALHNIMHKKLGLAKQKFPELSLLHSNEVKAKDAYPCIKYHILECIAKKELRISYIVADLKHVKLDSDDKNAYIVQAADYIANALYGFYEYNDGIYYNQFKHSIDVALRFPWKLFGK